MKRSLLALCLLVSAATLDGQTLTAVLARMDEAAPEFRGVSANLQMTTYTAILSDTTVETGTLQMQRLRANDVRAIIDFTTPPATKEQGQQEARKMAFFGKKVIIYYPKTMSYNEYDVGKNSNILNQFLLLGFGSTGKELQQSYNITLEGPANVAGEDTAKLLLIPKDPKMLEHLSKVEIWVPNGKSYPVQQQFYEPSGNYRKVIYSSVKLNPAIQGTLELKLPPNAKKLSQ